MLLCIWGFSVANKDALLTFTLTLRDSAEPHNSVFRILRSYFSLATKWTESAVDMAQLNYHGIR